MNENTAPVRRRIDLAQIDEWRNECLAAARHGTDERTLEHWLKENGCPPRTREDILVQARGVRRLHHRGLGAKTLGLGLLLSVAAPRWSAGRSSACRSGRACECTPSG